MPRLRSLAAMDGPTPGIAVTSALNNVREAWPGDISASKRIEFCETGFSGVVVRRGDPRGKKVWGTFRPCGDVSLSSSPKSPLRGGEPLIAGDILYSVLSN